MKRSLMLALYLGLAASASYAQTLPDQPAGVPSVPADPALPGDGDKPLQDPGQKVSPQNLPTADFSRLDANADGKISRSEAKTDASFSGRFKGMDANADGSISEQEFKASGSASGSTQQKKKQ